MPPTPGCTPPTPSFIPATPRRHGTKRPCGHHLPPPQRRDVATRPLADPRWPLTTRPPSPRRCSTVDSASSPSLDPAATGRRSACRGMLPPRSGRLQSYRGRCRAARLALARPPWAAWPGSPASVWVPSGGARGGSAPRPPPAPLQPQARRGERHQYADAAGPLPCALVRPAGRTRPSPQAGSRGPAPGASGRRVGRGGRRGRRAPVRCDRRPWRGGVQQAAVTEASRKFSAGSDPGSSGSSCKPDAHG